jgi:hypothetical protein
MWAAVAGSFWLFDNLYTAPASIMSGRKPGSGSVEFVRGLEKTLGRRLALRQGGRPAADSGERQEAIALGTD